MSYIEQGSLLCIAIGIIIMIMSTLLARKNRNLPGKDTVKNPKFAILIPARDESKVITGLLSSLKEQTMKIDMKDVYVIVEDKHDPTCKLVETFHASFIVRKNLTLQRKGYALDEAVKQILKEKKHYDAYFVIDADNVLDSHYLEEMKKVYDKGYDVGSGYRNLKNGNTNIISACSGLIFSLINAIGNEDKIKYQQNIVTIGSGFFVRGDIVEKWGGFPFYSLSEDYEFSLYATLMGYTTYYNKKAMFFDEQPVTYHETVKQRVRWIRGYFEARKKYIPKLYQKYQEPVQNEGSILGVLVGIIPYLFIIIGVVIYLLFQLWNLGLEFILKEQIETSILIKLGITFFVIYLVLLFLTAYILWKERKTINLNTKRKVQALFLHPFYLMTYLPCAIQAFMKKEIKWEKIEHREEKVVKN